MNGERPPAVLILGIVNFLIVALAVVLGGLGLKYFTTLWELSLSDKQAEALVKAIGRQVPGWLGIEIARTTLMVLLGIFLFFATLALLRLRPGARRACMAYAALAILLHLAALGFELGMVKPAADAMRNVQPLVKRDASQETAVLLGIVGGAVLFAGHGAAVLFVLTNRKVRRVFTGKSRGQPAPLNPDASEDA